MQTEATYSLINELGRMCRTSPEAIVANDKSRKHLQSIAARLNFALDTPIDSIRKIIFQPHQLVALRIGVENGWFEALTRDDTPKTAEDLAEATGAEILLIIRLMRVLTWNGIVEEVGVNTYAPTAVCKALTIPGIYHGIYHFFDENWPCFVKFPGYLKKNGYRVPNDPNRGLFQETFGTTQWQYFASNPGRGKSFDIFMTGQREGRTNWLSVYPFERLLLPGTIISTDDVLLVDVAGGQGHDLQDFRKSIGNASGRLVLQDLPHVLNQMCSEYKVGIELMEYDYFTPQPIKGARVYYFRSIMHDWDDENCKRILRSQISAMRRGYSRILINDHILSDRSTDLFGAGMDIAMMTLLCGMERTRQQWHSLLDSVGLRIVEIYTLEEGGEGVIEAELRDTLSESLERPGAVPAVGINGQET